MVSTKMLLSLQQNIINLHKHSSQLKFPIKKESEIPTGCGKKVIPSILQIFQQPHYLEFFDETLQLHSLFIRTYKCQI